MRWFTSDTHFGHARIIELCNRPFADIDEMDHAIITNWNNVVGVDDHVYHLGDLALGPKDRWLEIFNQLNGRLILIIGNHDALFAGNKPKYRDKYSYLYDRFDYAASHDSLSIDGRPVLLSHFPYDGDSHGEDRYSDYRLDDVGLPLVHGHTHGPEHATFSKDGTPQFHVGMDAWNYFPVSEERIRAWLNNMQYLDGLYGV